MAEHAQRSMAEPIDQTGRPIDGRRWLGVAIAYLAASAAVAFVYATVSQAMGVPRSNDAFLFDLIIIGVAPTLAVFWWLSQAADAAWMRQKRSFLQAYASAHLVVHKTTPSVIYEIVTQDPKTVTVKTVWNSDGRVQRGPHYQVHTFEIERLDRAAFLG